MPPKKNKRPKDPNAPKRPASSYILFNKSRQAALKEQHPDKRLTELTKLIGAEWKAMSTEEKEPFDREAKEKKAVYQEEMAAYKGTAEYHAYQQRLKNWKNNKDDDEEVPIKRPKDPNAPKKAMSAFFIFQTARRRELKEQHPDKKNTELSKMTGAEWKAMSAEDRQPFEAEARQKKAEYEATLATYKESAKYAEYQETLREWEEAKKRKLKKKKAPPPSPESSDGSDESEDSEGSDDDGDTRMSRRPEQSSSEDDEDYSSSSDSE